MHDVVHSLMCPQSDKNVNGDSAEVHKSRATSLEMIPEYWKEGREQASVREGPARERRELASEGTSCSECILKVRLP